MHQPPAWVLEDAEWLTLDGFQEAFGKAWRRLSMRFVKVECWQRYREVDSVRSQTIFQAGDVARARRLLIEEAAADQPLYDDIANRGIDFTRMRLIAYPLTDYLRYEMINYEIRQELGEHIAFLEPPRPVSDYFDFLLFDSAVALVHDYGPGPVGHQKGGWVTRVPQALDGLAALVADLNTHGRSLSRPGNPAGTSHE